MDPSLNIPDDHNRSSESSTVRQSSICSGCGLRILDRYYLFAVDCQWHNDCLKCSVCGMNLSNQLTCFARDGSILCKEDYSRRYMNTKMNSQSKCGRCGDGIGSQELIMRAKDLIFHLNCFFCVICMKILNKGDRFAMRNESLYCQEHYELVLEQEDSNFSNIGSDSVPPLNYFNGTGSCQKGRPRKRNKDMNIDLISNNTPIDLLTNNQEVSLRSLEGGYESSSSSCPGGGSQRTKRMRTSFKHHQLRTMKSYFNINQNPDAKDLKQLAGKTGLSKRVLQVWFQNARAKWRRNMIRSEGGGSISGGGGGTPTRPEDDLNISSNTQLHSDDGGFSSDIY